MKIAELIIALIAFVLFALAVIFILLIIWADASFWWRFLATDVLAFVVLLCVFGYYDYKEK
jgi:hypothetical protein